MIITTKLNCKQKTIHQKHHQARKQQNALAELLPRNPINERGLNHIINICRIIYIMRQLQRRFNQQLGVIILRCRKNLRGRIQLNNFSVFHDGNPVCHCPHGFHIM